MHIKSAEFLKGLVGTDEIFTSTLPQLAFVGRSNVGKSSVINSLLGTKDLVKSSSKPGCTRQINFFLINKKVYFVDLPGYGYAKTSQKDREKMRKMIMWYLSYNEGRPKKVFLIVDANVGLKEFDYQMIELLRENEHNFSIIANKVDKIKKSELVKKKNNIKRDLPEMDVIFYSAKNDLGREDVLNEI